MSTISVLGKAPAGFGHVYERPWLWIEKQPRGGVFQEPAPFLVERCRITCGANDRLPTAEITLSMGRNLDLPFSPTGSPNDPLSKPLRDWQLYDGHTYFNPDELVGSTRRVQIKTNRDQPSTNWCLFEGFVEGQARGWSGSAQGKNRFLTLYCRSTIVAADREVNQSMCGQWWRSRRAELALRGDGSGAEQTQCVRVTSEPCIFNPGGLPNMSADALRFSGTSPEQVVFVFGNADEAPLGRSRFWNIARILRYIQWSAVQPAWPTPTVLSQPYDQELYSRPGTLGMSGAQWTTFNLAHIPSVYNSASGEPINEVGPNLSDLIDPFLERFDQGDPANAQDQALLRVPTNLCIQGMTALEAFVYVCDQAGILFHVDHDVDNSGRVWTFLKFTVRGDRCPGGAVPGGIDDQVSPQAETPAGGSGIRAYRVDGRTCTARGVRLYVRSDWDKSGSPASAAEAYKNDGPNEGVISEDVSLQRNKVLVFGAPTQYEITTKALLPGWRNDAANLWDGINPTNEAAVQAALTVSATPNSPWDLRYGNYQSGLQYRDVGRFWVLNEDGQFTPDFYRRQYGEWSTDAKWAPYKFRSEAGIYELANRGDNYWALRRRRFLPLIAKYLRSLRYVEPQVELSFQAGAANSWIPASAAKCNCDFDQDRCAVWVRGDVLQIVDPISGRSYYESYIRNLLRVRVIANIEGDDALLAWAPSESSAGTWAEVLDRSQALPRILRTQPDGQQPAATSDVLANSQLPEYATYGPYVTGQNRDAQSEALRLAARLREELIVPRFSGQCTIPWLWRDRFGPVTGYRIGDEVLGIETGDNDTQWSFLEGRPPGSPAPRIIQVTYTYAQDEQSTSLQIEDHAFGVDDVAGSPTVSDPRRWMSNMRPIE